MVGGEHFPQWMLHYGWWRATPAMATRAPDEKEEEILAPPSPAGAPIAPIFLLWQDFHFQPTVPVHGSGSPLLDSVSSSFITPAGAMSLEQADHQLASALQASERESTTAVFMPKGPVEADLYSSASSEVSSHPRKSTDEPFHPSDRP